MAIVEFKNASRACMSGNHEQLAARTVFIKLHTPQEPVLEHMARVIVIDSAAEHEYAVIALARI